MQHRLGLASTAMQPVMRGAIELMVREDAGTMPPVESASSAREHDTEIFEMAGGKVAGVAGCDALSLEPQLSRSARQGH